MSSRKPLDTLARAERLALACRPVTAVNAKGRILDDFAAAIDQVALAIAALGAAFEQLPAGAAERLEDTLFRPVQKAYARGKRTHAGFAGRHGLATGVFELPSPGLSSQGVPSLVEQAVAGAAAADRRIAELQDSMLPVESGDGEVRALLAGVPVNAREFVRTLGR